MQHIKKKIGVMLSWFTNSVTKQTKISIFVWMCKFWLEIHHEVILSPICSIAFFFHLRDSFLIVINVVTI